ncbi:hypothetical protein T440DRAFT_521405 [Plenodomus tracheiphilus IPT5]|uniref:REJ domain-containing protein n=1 Tax=Plenodomus tracheiphilus IPT5 TaxID=1408161 RepID=A0A6A7AXB5_9PLEO|nr:hypothetical protein T440DRAFT_521405 [Plenodomus tracheiphilus IPT5]
MAPLRSIDAPARQHSEESWIEIGSRPSSSSLSSATDEIITTGLTVQHDSNLHRRNRRLRASNQFQVGTGHRITAAGGGNSSQEEYEESESESDRVLSSSTEGIGPSPLRQEVGGASRSPLSVASSETMSEREDDDEDDENATAVNYPRSTRREFQPRPNAFSHSNEPQPIRSQSGTVYTPRRNARPSSQRQHSYPQHSPYNALAPNYQPDHDEALRASLSTLLSAAAAVRGLPKPGQPRTGPPPSSTRLDPTTLRMVPESVALGETSEEPSSPRTASSCPTDKSKRKASPPGSAGTRSSSKDRRGVKKARKTGPLIEEISPTLLTWVVSAGVVVLVSALSFSAGYVVGKEAGHAEVLGQMGAAGGEAGRCGKEAAAGLKGTGLGLRKLRWSGSTGIRV